MSSIKQGYILCLVCPVRPWKGGNNRYNGVWVDNPAGRIFITRNSLPQLSSKFQYRHVIKVYLPEHVQGRKIVPSYSRKFGNNGRPVANIHPQIQGSFFVVPEAYFTCTHFMACTHQRCFYHPSATVLHINCNLKHTSPSHQQYITGGWCDCGGRLCLEIRSAAIGRWLEALFNTLGQFPQLAIYHLRNNAFIIDI